MASCHIHLSATHFHFLSMQLLDMVGSHLERPTIHAIFKHNYPHLITMCTKELDEAKRIYDHQLDHASTIQGPQISKNMPQCAGVLKWCQELRERVTGSVEKFKTMGHGYVNHSIRELKGSNFRMVLITLSV